MSVPAHLAVNVRPEDYFWHRLEPKPAPKPHIVQPITRIEDIESPCVAETISADQFAKRLDAYWDKIVRIPDWQEQMLAKTATAKLAKREERRQRKEQRKAA